MPGLLRRCCAATAATVLVVTLAGCSDDSEGSSSPEPSSSESATPSGPSLSSSPTPTESESPEPELPKRPPAKDDEAGRKAFAEFVVSRWGYALRTNEATALTKLSPEAAPCAGCAAFEDELKKRSKQGWYVDFPGAKVVKVALAPGGAEGVQVATATINVPASTSYFEDGEVRNENEARKGATFEVQMRLDGKSFVLLAFRVI